LEELRITYSSLVGKPQGKRLRGRPRCRWEDNIKMDNRQIFCEGLTWIYWYGTGSVGGILRTR
jgi:hypothetical protein